MAEAHGFGLTIEIDDAFDGEIGFDRDAEFHGLLPFVLVCSLRKRLRALHQNKVNNETHKEADEPGVVVQNAKLRHEEADECDTGAGHQRDDSLPVESALIFVETIALI